MQTDRAGLTVTCELEKGHEGRHRFDFTAPRLGLVLNRDATFLEWDHAWA